MTWTSEANTDWSSMADAVTDMFMTGAGMKKPFRYLTADERDRIRQIREALQREVDKGNNVSFYESVFFLRIIDRLTQ